MSTDNENILETELLEFSDKELKMIHASAAIARIYGNYSKENSSISHPPEDASYLECIQFYKENYQSAEELLVWFKESRSEIEAWSKNNNKNYLERWKEVAKAELQSIVTLENIKKLGFGKVSRIFNDAPVENVLFPYELKEIIDDFLPNAKKTQDMQTASDQMMAELADVFNKRFIETGLLSNIIDDHQKKGEEGYKNLLETVYGNNVYPTVGQYTENLKKDLMCSFLQPLGNYIETGHFGTEKIRQEEAGRKIAYNKFQYILLKNVEKNIEKGKTLSDSIQNIKENPKNFKFIVTAGTEEQDYEEGFLASTNVNIKEFFSPTAETFTEITEDYFKLAEQVVIQYIQNKNIDNAQKKFEIEEIKHSFGKLRQSFSDTIVGFDKNTKGYTENVQYVCENLVNHAIVPVVARILDTSINVAENELKNKGAPAMFQAKTESDIPKFTEKLERADKQELLDSIKDIHAVSKRLNNYFRRIEKEDKNNKKEKAEPSSKTPLSFFSNLRESVSAIFAFLFVGKKNDNSKNDDLEPSPTEAVFTPLVEASPIEQNKDETDSDLSRYSLARRIPSSELSPIEHLPAKNIPEKKVAESSYATSMKNLFNNHFSLNPFQSKQPIHNRETHDKIVQDLEKKHPDVVHLLERLDDAILKQQEKIATCTKEYEVAKSNHSPSLEELKAERDKNTELYENLNRSYNNISFLLDDYDEKRKKTDFERAEKILKETDPMNNSKENEKTGSFEKQRPLPPQSVEEVQPNSTHKILFSKKPTTAELFKGDDTNTNTNTTPSSENLNSLRQPM